jgi:uncharacterized protein YjiS (DUF1127 family)
MTQIDIQTRPAARLQLGGIFVLLREWHRTRRDDAVIKALPRDRLHDIGLAPRSRVNLRHSGERGPIPGAELW